MRRFLGALLVLFSGPSFAGVVYIPVIASLEDNGVPYEMRISISNPSPQRAELTATFLVVNTNGIAREDNPGQTEVLEPGATLQVVSESGFVGLVEIDGADDLIFDARLVGLLSNSETPSEQVPIISSANQAVSDSTAYLQGWLRDPNHLATFGLVNLGQQPSDCSVDVFREDGAALVTDVEVTVKPRSLRHFGDGIVGLLGEFQGARAAVTCSQPFYTYGATFRDSGEVVFVRHSGLGSSTIPPVGVVRTCPAGSLCFQKRGIFHTPRPGNLVRRIGYRPPAGEYRRVKVTLDVRHGGWAANESGTHNIFWFVRDRNRDMFGYLNVQGPSKNDIFLRHGFNLDHVDKPKLQRNLSLTPGETYRFEYTFDTENQVIELLVFDQSGAQISQIRTTPNVNTITFTEDQRALIDFGFDGSNPNEPATRNWDYKDLFVEFVPR